MEAMEVKEDMGPMEAEAKMGLQEYQSEFIQI